MHILSCLLLLTTALFPGLSEAEEIGYPLRLSDRFDSDGIYMAIRLRGALSLHGSKALSELSDLAWDEDENVLYGVTDRGRLLHLQPIIERGVLTGIKLLRDFHLRDRRGKKLKGFEQDSEGLALEGARNGIRGDSLLAVSFEGRHRVDLYSPEGEYLRPVKLPAKLSDPELYRGTNNGLEALAHHPEFGYLTGPEKTLTGDEIPIFSQSGPSWRYRPIEPDGALVAFELLDDQTLIILERAFSSIFEPLVISLSAARLDASQANSPLETRLLASFDSTDGWQTQNLEGLTPHRERHFFMVSDDGGDGYLQTQLIYFEIP